MVYRIVALDPGGTTGWATYTATRMANIHDEVEYYDEKFDCGQIGPHDHHKKLNDFLGLQQTYEYTIVCESFEFRNMDKRHRDNIELISKEYIGVVKLFAEERMLGRNDQTLVMQTAGLAKSFIPDSGPQANKKLRTAGLWYPGQKHAMDAMRHLLWYLVNRENRMDLVEKWWKPSS